MNPTRILLASATLVAGMSLGYPIRAQDTSVKPSYGALEAADASKQLKILDYHRSQWNPIHFKPAIDQATDAQCLECHQEIIDRRVLDRSPAGLKAADALAWYQTLDTYKGAQDTFHRRHLVDDYAKQVMDLKCNTCHQGNDPREEVPEWPGMSYQDFTMRKMVNPDICLRCHGQFPYKLIEQAALEDPDVCYGCHGGRAWYRIAYPFPRHAWEGMSAEMPDWAKDRPTESEPRFRVSTQGGEIKTN
jgi:hypothetical protein